MNSPEANLARLETKVDDLSKLVEHQRQEGNERGGKIEDMKKELASQNARLSEMERHVHNECVWGSGEISNIKEDLATLTADFKNVNKSVELLAQSVEKMRTYIIWIIAGSAIGGGAASGASELLLKVLGG